MKSAKIFLEFLNPVMNGNLALRQERLKRKLSHSRETARLWQRQALSLKQCEGELPLHLALRHVGGREHLVRDGYWHNLLTLTAFSIARWAKKRPCR